MGGVSLRSLAGSPWWVGQVCHGTPHLHCQRWTNFCRRQALHQVRWLSLSSPNLSFVPSTACLQVGQCSRIMSGSLTCVSTSGALLVVRLCLACVLCLVCFVVFVVVVSSLVLLRKRSSVHFHRLASHFVLPLVLNLCWITQCLSCSFCIAALCEQLVCDCMILVASSSSAAGVSWTEIGSVVRWVVMPRCIKGCPSACPFKMPCWAIGQRTLTILLTCSRKCCRHCPRLHLVMAWSPPSAIWGAGVLKPIMWNMMSSSIQVLPFVAVCVASLCR